ncbi:hypothetical protein LtaPh_3026000 [Leishmania tarentolae]|uniref:Uncharacterized protein n=1 Tax=Leishmania tarentolae TaxID=5689 RepID=A0A640KNE8_LEITA|nr:hypothetical protein LtaPh_3026000 [Leishmania tarentolae]
MHSVKVVSFLAALAAVTLGALLALTTTDVRALLTDAVPYRVPEDCPAKHLTAANFEHDTQASGGMTSGNWLILFVPSNDGATADRHSRQAVSEIASFDSFVRLSAEVLSTHQVLPAYVLCDESPALCVRFKVENSSAKLIILSARHMHLCPSEQTRTVSGIELFVSGFRRTEGSAVPPPQPGFMMQGRLLLLLGGIVGIVVLRLFVTCQRCAPRPPSATAFRAKTD